MRATLVVLLGALAFWALGAASMRYGAPAVERELAVRVGAALSEAGLSGEAIRVDGRDVIVEGALASSAAFPEVERVLSSVEGVRRIERRTERPLRLATVRVSWEGADVSVQGELAPQDAQGDLPGRLREVFGIPPEADSMAATDGPTFVDSVHAEPEVALAFWVDALPEIVALVRSEVAQGGLVIEGRSLTVRGSVADENTRSELGERLATRAPDLNVINRISVQAGATLASERLEALLEVTDITFEDRSDNLTVESRALLDQVAVLLDEFPGVSLTIKGYFDNGHPTQALVQSRVKAIAVRDYLLSVGVRPSVLTTLGLGLWDEVSFDTLASGGEFVRVTLDVNEE